MRSISPVKGLLFLSYVFLFSYPIPGQVSAKSLLVMGHTSGYRIKGIEKKYETTQGRAAFSLEDAEVIRGTIFDSRYQEYTTVCRYGLEFMRAQLAGREITLEENTEERVQPIRELSDEFMKEGIRMKFNGNYGCGKQGDISCITVSDFSDQIYLNANPHLRSRLAKDRPAFLNASPGTEQIFLLFIQAELEPTLFYIYELGHFVFIATYVSVQAGVLIANGYIHPRQPLTCEDAEKLAYFDKNNTDLKPVTVMVRFRHHTVEDYEEAGNLVTIQTHFNQQYTITEKQVSLYPGHRMPLDIGALGREPWDLEIDYDVIMYSSALIVPDFDDKRLRTVISRMGLRTHYFDEPLKRWLFGWW